MNKKYLCIKDNLLFETKGSTPKYVNESLTIVLNQKCVRNGMVDYSFSQYISEQQNIADEKYVKIGDVLLNSTGQGTAGRCALVDYIPENYKVTVDSHMLILRFENIELARFFAYSLYKQESYILELLTGSSGQGELDREIVYNISFPFDDKNLKIFNKILVAINNKIKLNNKINQELENLAKTLYEYWFVQFDFPDENKRPYKSSGGKMIYNEKLKREIPIDWEVKQIGNIIQEQEKSSVQVNQADNTGKYPFFTSGNEILKYNIYFVDDICCYLSTGGNACVKYYYGKASYSTDTWCISANEYTFYLYNYLVSINNQMDKLYFAGTGLKHLQKDIFKNSYIVIPPYDYIEKYNNIVSNGYKMSSKNYLQNQELAVIRDYLLPLLMNGQICII